MTGGAYVAFDLETTGLSPKTDRLLEVGALRLDADLSETARFELVADPGMPIPLAVQRLVGLSDADVRGAPSPLEAAAQLAEFAAGAVLVVHGGLMDLQVCRALLPEQFSRRLVLDTLDLARIVLPTVENHGLPQLSRRLGLRHVRPHRALSDAEATAHLLAILRGEAAVLPAATLAALRDTAARDPALGHFFSVVVPGHGTARTRPAVDSNDAAGSAPGGRPEASLPDDAPPAPAAAPPPSATGRPAGEPVIAPAAASTRTPDLEAATVELLGVDGPFATSPTYEYRAEQIEMARAVAQALERRRHVLVEAGTGVGKSRAYLAPLMLWARAGGGRAVVATHTVTLQEQLVETDVPVLRAAMPEAPTVAMLKGRNHYVSLRRWERFRAAAMEGDGELDRLRFTLKVLVWLAGTATGDRAELHLTGGEETYWSAIASDAGDCLGSRCGNWATRRCHMVAARQRAADAQVIVTNHALLLGATEPQRQLLPEYQALVVDEAHHLEEAATEQLGTTVTGQDLALALDRLPVSPAGEVALAVARCREAGQRLFGDVKGFVGGRQGGGNARVTVDDVASDPAFATVVRSGRHAAGVLQTTAEVLAGAASSGVQGSLLPQPERADDEVALAATALAGMAAAIQRVLCGDDPAGVRWLEVRGEQAELHEAPVSVARVLRDRLFAAPDRVVLTSATLSVGGSFAFIRSRLGIADSAEELVLASPYDYFRQALCVVPEALPPYDEPAHEQAMARLIGAVAERLGGRTLVLFTSYGPLRRVQAQLRDRLEAQGLAILGQGVDGTRRQILRSFLEDPRTVLLGTSSFWEGIDIPSERLRCVIIDKLPFAVPTDPLVRARTAGLHDAFGQYVLPLAVLRLRQGFGRLIRSHADRGAVILCDDRLNSRQYGDIFLRALPPAAVSRAPVDDIGAMVAAFVAAGGGARPVGQ